MSDPESTISLGYAPEALVKSLKGQDEQPHQFSDHLPHGILISLSADAETMRAKKKEGPMDKALKKVGQERPAATEVG